MINWSDFDTSQHKQSPSIGWLFAALIALILIRFWGLAISEVEVMFDEAQYWTWSLEPAWGYFSKPPLIAWLIGLENAICGVGKVCTRSAVPILHTCTALVIYVLGRRLFSHETGFWSALMFALLPGITFSSRFITTDVPLLLCWAVALCCVWELRTRKSLWLALLLGIAVGLGLLAKYAMIYFVLCLTVFLIMDSEARRSIWKGGLAIAACIALLLMVPNIVWNIQNGLITVFHTADNMNWSGQSVSPAEAGEFLGAQFGVFGPITMAFLLALVFRPRLASPEGQFPSAIRFLYAFSVPVVAIILFQAFMSRAHANWAAPAYVAGTLLVTQMLLVRSWRKILVLTLGLHVIIQAGLVFMDSRASRLTFPFGIDLYYRALGYEELAQITQNRFNSGEYQAILSDWRRITATLLYNLRDNPPPIVTWPNPVRPGDHYELTRPMTEQHTGTLLLITRCNIRERLDAAFESWTLKEVVTTKGGPRYNWNYFMIKASKPRLDQMPAPECSEWPADEITPIVSWKELPPRRVR